MITYVKGNYVDAYNLLYQEAVDALNKYYKELPEEHPSHGLVVEQADISNLAQYFHYMHDLTQIDVSKNELKFTKLPLDEAHFKIDLDSRVITVPKAFEKGVSVRGDEIAEIVYFEVDRYYDATDLNEQEIIIEWINAAGQKGYSRPYGKDVDLIPGKIVFGWPLSSKVTAKDGSVQFAVRFYDATDTVASSGIVYSLSTLMQTIKIYTTIDIRLEDIINKSAEILEDNTLDVIAARAVNSKNEDGAKPGVPVIFYLGEELGANDGNGDAVPANLARVVYINTPTADGAPGAVTISAGVYADGDGVTTGSFWKKFTYEVEDMFREGISEQEYEKLDEEDKAKYDENFFAGQIYIDYAEVAVVDAKAEINARAENAAGVIYYTKEDQADGAVKYRKVAASAVLAMDDNGGPVYRQDYTATITDIGVYQFQAEVAAGSNKEERNSHYILVFPPVRPKNVHVEGNTMMAKNEAGKFVTTLNAAMDAFGTELDADLLPPAFVGYEAQKELYPFDGTREWPTYKWYHNENVKSAVADLNDEDWTTLEGVNEDLAVEEVEGYYKCGIVGHLNNHISEEIISAPYRVTMPASEFTVTISGQDSFGRAISATTDANVTTDNMPEIANGIEYPDGDTTKGLTVTPVLVNEKYMDYFTYEWYRYVCNKEDSGEYNVDLADAVNAMHGLYEPDLKGTVAWPADLLQEGADKAEFIPAQDGVYFCVITNTYNDDTHVVCSPFMAFNYNENK